MKKLFVIPQEFRHLPKLKIMEELSVSNYQESRGAGYFRYSFHIDDNWILYLDSTKVDKYGNNLVTTWNGL